MSELCEIGGQGGSDPEAEREPCGKVLWRSQSRKYLNQRETNSHKERWPRAVRVFGYGESSYLVDPASSHMLVSKIKPCMSKYKQICTVKLRMAH